MTIIKNRVKELRHVPARELIANPKNWRKHPEQQSRLLNGTLREIGYADALLAREDADGRLHLIDGHLRAETTPDMEVPVLVVDLSEAEADKLLALLDPLAAMAETDSDLLEELIADLETGEESIQAYFDSVQKSSEKLLSEKEPQSEVAIPELFQIVIECGGEEEQRELFERLRGEGLTCRLLNL